MKKKKQQYTANVFRVHMFACRVRTKLRKNKSKNVSNLYLQAIKDTTTLQACIRTYLVRKECRAQIKENEEKERARQMQLLMEQEKLKQQALQKRAQEEMKRQLSLILTTILITKREVCIYVHIIYIYMCIYIICFIMNRGLNCVHKREQFRHVRQSTQCIQGFTQTYLVRCSLLFVATKHPLYRRLQTGYNKNKKKMTRACVCVCVRIENERLQALQMKQELELKCIQQDKQLCVDQLISLWRRVVFKRHVQLQTTSAHTISNWWRMILSKKATLQQETNTIQLQ
ncbi:hypothetical protein RFI_16745, partial [Reticulomyxa filosa]